MNDSGILGFETSEIGDHDYVVLKLQEGLKASYPCAMTENWEYATDFVSRFNFFIYAVISTYPQLASSSGTWQSLIAEDEQLKSAFNNRAISDEAKEAIDHLREEIDVCYDHKYPWTNAIVRYLYGSRTASMTEVNSLAIYGSSELESLADKFGISIGFLKAILAVGNLSRTDELEELYHQWLLLRPIIDAWANRC